jgi:epoxyqueuosine reductase
MDKQDNGARESEAEAARIKAQAREIGFDAVRITTAMPPGHADAMASWLTAGMHGEMGYLANRAELRAGPLSSENLLADARSVVVVALSYAESPLSPPDEEQRPRGTVARYARGTDYHLIMWEKLKTLGAWVETEWPEARARGFCDSGPIRERELAARAGLGWQGRHTNLISLDLGNWFFLGALLTTLPLPPDPRTDAHCGTCTRCLTSCPTGALVAPYTLDARRCISYLTIELKGPIPHHLRPRMGDRIFGCDDCLAACPWNGRARLGQEMRLAARDTDAAHPDLLELLALLADEEAFRTRFKNTPLRRPGRAGLRRNVCVALGNIGGAESVKPLADVLKSDLSPIVRGHAAWALGEIARRAGNTEILSHLYAANETESDEDVRKEISTALGLETETSV